MFKLVKESLLEISLEGSNLERMGLGLRYKIKRWLEDMEIKDFTINDDLTINVYGIVNLNNKLSEHRLPAFIKFKNVSGIFSCAGNELTSLEGCPKTVGGFSCNDNMLTSLEGCPEAVRKSFYCAGNMLTSLKGCPDTVSGGFSCSKNKLTSLKGCPRTVGDSFSCSCNELTSLEGCPEIISGNFWCYNNRLTYLKGCPKTVGSKFYCYGNKHKFSEEEVRVLCDVKGEIVI